MSVLKAILESSSVLRAIREDETAVAMHLILKEVAQVYSSILLICCSLDFAVILSIFFLWLCQGQLTAPMLYTILKFS